jgi:hypothetical protein
VALLLAAAKSDAVGAPSYASCALELANQANETGVAFDGLVHATGSAGTEAGAGRAYFHPCARGGMKTAPDLQRIQSLLAGRQSMASNRGLSA